MSSKVSFGCRFLGHFTVLSGAFGSHNFLSKEDYHYIGSWRLTLTDLMIVCSQEVLMEGVQEVKLAGGREGSDVCL